MRYLIVSDIHGNWEALEAVLSDAAGLHDQILCCGDLVGYGADPNPVVDWVRREVAVTVRGNHDKACCGLDSLEWFNPVAKAAAAWTLNALTPENLEYLRNLPMGPARVEAFQIVHGSPLDEDEYLISTPDAEALQGYLDSTLFFFGHSHLQGGFQCRNNRCQRFAGPAAREGEKYLELQPDSVYLLNPGSVGQPRDRDARASYILYDSSKPRAIFRRVPYDVVKAQTKIRQAGLPDLLAQRLAIGS